MGPPEFSVAVVAVNGDDVTGIRLAPAVPVLVSGRVSFDDAAAAQSIRTASVRVSGQPLDLDDALGIGLGGAMNGQLREDFTFELKTVAGRVALRVFVPGQAGTSAAWQVKSIRANGVDVTDAGVEVGGQGASGIDIEMTNRLQQVSGSVADAKGDRVKDYAVAVFPSDRSRWGAATARYFAIGRPGDDGQFKVSTLPPGEYYAVALDTVSPTEWQDPETLERLSRQASTFVLTPGDTRTLDLRLIVRRRPETTKAREDCSSRAFALTFPLFYFELPTFFLVHSAHAAAGPPGIGASFFSSGISDTSASVVSSSDAIDDGVLQRRADDLRRVDDAGLHQVLVGVGQRVEALVVLHLAHLLHDDRAFVARVGRDPPQRLLDGARDDVDADLLIAAELQVLEHLGPRAAAPRRRRARCLPRPPPWSRASRPRRAPSSPSSRFRSPRRP